MVQMLFPRQIALLVAIGVGLMEAWAGVMILVPRWRRWGSWLCGFLLLAFMVYMAVNYTRLTGEDCSCFPWLKRVVGPGFFIGDTVMLLMAIGAGWWANRAESWRQAVLALGALVVFAGAVYGVTVARQGGMKGPAEITADGASAMAVARLDIQDRGNQPQTTDVVQVDADVLDLEQQGDRQVVSVRFHGKIREEAGGPANDFDEVWHLMRWGDAPDWKIAGIQQRH